MTTHEMVAESLVRAEEARKASLALSAGYYRGMSAWHTREAEKASDSEQEKHLTEAQKHLVAAERLYVLSKEL